MDNIVEALLIMVVGLLGVFISLFFFYCIILAIQKSDDKINRFLVKKKLQPAKIESDIAQIKPEIVAAIAAAAYETFHKPIKIKRIHFLDENQSSQWTATGRITIMGSHNIKK